MALGTSRPQLHRIFYIDRAIREGRCPNARQLASELEVTQRTVHRDLEYLRDVLQAPLKYDASRHGYVYLAEYRLPPAALSEGEWVAMLFAIQWLNRLPASPLRDAVQGILNKLPAILPEDLSISPDQLDAPISIGVDTLRGDEERIAELQRLLLRAVRRHRRLHIVYFSSYRGEITERDIDPYHLRLADGNWYVIAFCHRAQDWRTFALDRIQAAEEKEETFYPQPFSVDQYLRYAWRHEVGSAVHDVAIRVAHHEVPYLAVRQWHWTQQTEPQADGTVILRFRVSGLQEMKRWLLQFGDGVEVLAPPALRELVASEARRILALYGTGEPRPT